MLNKSPSWIQTATAGTFYLVPLGTGTSLESREMQIKNEAPAMDQKSSQTKYNTHQTQDEGGAWVWDDYSKSVWETFGGSHPITTQTNDENG